MRPTLLLSGLLLVCPLAPAQTAAAGDDPHILIDTVGPDGWRIRLGPTNLGGLLESEKGRELWEPRLQPLLEMWRQLAGDEAAYAVSRTRLLDYGGRIRMGMWLDENERQGPDPAACVAVVLDGDGRSDLAAIAADLRALLYEQIPGEWEDVELGDATLAVRRDRDSRVTAPLLEDGRIVIAATSEGELELALRRARAMAGAGTAELRPDSPALRIRFDFTAIVAGFMANEDESDRRLMQALGIDSLGAGTATIGTAGPRVQLEYSQAFTRAERGLFGAFMPATKSIPSLLAAVGEGTWTVGHFDCLALYESIMDALEANGDEDPRAEVKRETGIDLAADLLAHMTDDVMLWLPEAENFDDTFDKTAWALTFRLRDDDAFRDGLLRLLPKARPFLQHERTEEYEDVELFRYGNMLGYDTWLAVGRDVFVMAGGRGADERTREVLGRVKALPAELPAEMSPPAGFEPLKRYLPPGTHGFAVGSATNIISLPSTIWLEILSGILPLPERVVLDPDEDAERREELAALLAEHRLAVARSATGFADNTWRVRIYW